MAKKKGIENLEGGPSPISSGGQVSSLGKSAMGGRDLKKVDMGIAMAVGQVVNGNDPAAQIIKRSIPEGRNAMVSYTFVLEVNKDNQGDFSLQIKNIQGPASSLELLNQFKEKGNDRISLGKDLSRYKHSVGVGLLPGDTVKIVVSGSINQIDGSKIITSSSL